MKFFATISGLAAFATTAYAGCMCQQTSEPNSLEAVELGKTCCSNFSGGYREIGRQAGSPIHECVLPNDSTYTQFYTQCCEDGGAVSVCWNV